MKIRGTFIGWLILIFLLLIATLARPRVNAQDDRLYACRTDRPDLVELQFHNIQSLMGPDQSIWFLGDAGYFDDQDLTKANVLTVQALTAYEPVSGCQDCVDEINFIHNGMAIVGNQDYSVEMVGTIDTPLCGQGAWYATMSGSDFSVLPDQTPPVIPTVNPTDVSIQSQPVSIPQTLVPQPTSCPYLEITLQGQPICHS